jgi:hypothetical protein
MSLAARKSDVRSHLCGPVKRHYLSPDSTNSSEKMVAAERGNGETSVPDADFEERPSSAGVYTPNTIAGQR